MRGALHYRDSLQQGSVTFCYRGALVGALRIRRIGSAQGFQSIEARFDTANAVQNRAIGQILCGDLFLVRFQQHLKVSLKGCQHAHLLARLLLECCHAVGQLGRGMNDLLQGESPVVVLAGLQDPGNVGTILRVAESFGASGCLGLSGTVAIHNSKVSRASTGSVFRLPHVWNLELEEVVATLKTRNVPLIGTSPHAVDSITSWDWSRPVAVLIGNEGAGLNREQTEACTTMLRVPHEPQTESLNSAIAAAVVLYEAYRKRNFT